MQDDHQPNMRALRREWLSARIVAALGALMVIAVLAVLVTDWMSASEAPPLPTATPVVPTQIPPADSAAARRAEDIALCDAALATVQGVGLLPAFAQRDGDKAEATQTQGRYVCHAKTTAAKYSIAFDLACTHLGDAGCIVPYSVAQDGGGVLYQRP